MELERLLRSQGFGSRPDCRELVRNGRVAINSEICDDPYAEFNPENLEFAVDGVRWRYTEKVYLVMNKPGGYEVSHQPHHHPSVFELLPKPLLTRGVQAVGRLDEDTTGLLLLVLLLGEVGVVLVCEVLLMLLTHVLRVVLREKEEVERDLGKSGGRV